MLAKTQNHIARIRGTSLKLMIRCILLKFSKIVEEGIRNEEDNGEDIKID